MPVASAALAYSAVTPNPSLHPICYSGLRPLPQALAVALFEVLLALVGVFLALGQHRVDEPCQLVRAAVTAFGLSIREHKRR